MGFPKSRDLMQQITLFPVSPRDSSSIMRRKLNQPKFVHIWDLQGVGGARIEIKNNGLKKNKQKQLRTSEQKLSIVNYYTITQ